MNETQTPRPRMGFVSLAFPGYNLGEKLCVGKHTEMRTRLSRKDVEVIEVHEPIHDRAAAKAAGEQLRCEQVDCILALITTFVPDHFILDLLDRCDVPIFLWAVEREMQCISLVCGPLITATLFELEKHYSLAGADIDDQDTMNQLLAFSRAAMLQRLLAGLHVGYAGGKNNIMFSMTADDYTLKKVLGVTTVTIDMQEFHDIAADIKDSAITEYRSGIEKSVGCIDAPEQDCIRSARYCLATTALCQRYRLGALSINCFPYLKSQICLAVARLNDTGIAAACEGDLYSTVLMYMIQSLQDGPSFNGDWLRMFPDRNDVLFSHCGAGAFGLAESPSCVKLQASLETKDGLAVCYPTRAHERVTLANMMGARETFRIAAMCGKGVPTDTEYEGTPLRVHFETPVKNMLDRISATGAGHHWNGAMHDCLREFELLCRFRKIRFNPIN